MAITTRVKLNIFNEIETNHLFKGSVVIVDQGIVSGVRFFISLLLARYVTPAEYGGFVLAYGVLMLVNYIQVSYILVPMSVLCPSLGGEELKNYYGCLLKIQIVLSAVMSVILVVTSHFWLLWFKEPGIDTIFMAMGFSAFAVQMQEFFRKIFFNHYHLKKAILNDAMCYLGQLVGIFILVWNRNISSVLVFWVITIFSLLAAFWGYCLCRNLFKIRTQNLKQTVMKQFNYGKWLLASMSTQWISGQIYIYIAASFLSISAAGILGACRNLFGIINVALTGIRNILLPYGSRKFSLQGISFLKEYFKKIYMLGSISLVIYVLVISAFSRHILDFLYRGQYRGFEYVVILFAVQSLINFFAFPPDTGLLIMKKTEGIFKSYLVSSIISFVIAFPLIKLLDLRGALIGMIATQLLLVMVLTNLYRKETVKLVELS